PTMRGAVRPICDSRSKLFRGCQYTRSSYLQYGAVHNGGTSRGAARRCRLFSASSQGQRSRQKVPSPSDPASEKVICERRAHQARSSPGATQKAGFLTSTTSLSTGGGGGHR